MEGWGSFFFIHFISLNGNMYICICLCIYIYIYINIYMNYINYIHKYRRNKHAPHGYIYICIHAGHVFYVCVCVCIYRVIAFIF